MNGLAQSMAQPQNASPSSFGPTPTVEEVMALLMQGIEPQALIEQGIPPELVQEAVAMLQQQMAAQQQAVPPEAQGGLAAQAMGM